MTFELRLVYPMLAMVLLTFVVLITLFRSRVRMIREGHAPVSYFRTFQGSQEPDYAIKPARHFANLFEAPTLFYAACVTAMVVGVTGWGVLALAWGYVAMRCLHARIHLGGNRVRHRLRVYFAGWLILLAMWVYIAVVAARGTLAD
ncbi:MAG TPA: MAPEG family protein [Steroidobacteraceae bacterium]|nr:MAPEG family protein [Steroidobacteraceae bacterium]